MKTRIRLARYQDIFHIEAALQEAIDNPEVVPYIPPIEKPLFYNIMNHLIPRGEVILGVVDDKLAGFATMSPSGFMWNESSFIINGSIVVRKQFRDSGIQIEMLTGMVNHAKQLGTGLMLRAFPGIPLCISADEMVQMGGIVDAGCALFLDIQSLENGEE